jgi:hypothetical protein
MSLLFKRRVLGTLYYPPGASLFSETENQPFSSFHLSVPIGMIFPQVFNELACGRQREAVAVILVSTPTAASARMRR